MNEHVDIAGGRHPGVAALQDALGGKVRADDQTRDFYANDVFWQPGIRPLAIVFPSSAGDAAAAVRIAADNGIAVVPRGGGMSYTKGYLPAVEDAIVIDACDLDSVIEVNTDDLYVTVEAGCTWADLDKALEGTGLRTGYWGPLSGINATVGGALSQNSAFFGSTLNATVAESVIGLSVVLPDGTLVTTGSGGRRDTKPFTREGGPDLTGLFLGDTGALGFKTAATLRLWPKPLAVGFLSFGFRSMADMAGAQVAMARERLVSEGFGIDRTKASHSASVNRISDGLKVLGNVAKTGKTLMGSIKDAAAVAAGGTSFLKKHEFTLHLVLEARNDDELAVSMARAREICADAGTELDPSVPRVMRSKPFGPVRGMLGLNGERWVPIHAVFPMGDWRKVVEANDAFFAERKPFMDEHGIVYSVMSLTVGNEFFIEPAFYWHDEITPLHVQSVGEDITRPWLDRPANPAARQAVAELRDATQQLYISLGGVNWQVARDYPFRSVLNPPTWDLLSAIKRSVDPNGIMNPGSLGLADPSQSN